MKFVLLDYPSGLPGLALVMMRVSLSGFLAFVAVGRTVADPVVSTGVAVLACLIAAGFLARLAASLFAIAGLLSIAVGALSLTYASLPIEGIALALLGPGAWSIDAWTLQSSVVTFPDRPFRDR